MDTCKLFILILLTGVICSSSTLRPVKDKEYKLVLIEEKYHSINTRLATDPPKRQWKGDVIYDHENIKAYAGILTQDSIYIGTYLSEMYKLSDFELYTIHSLGKNKALLKMEKGEEKDSLFISMDTRNHILQINQNKYYLNASYAKWIQKEGFRKNSMYPFLSFIHEHIDDFYAFHPLTTHRWLPTPDFPKHRILSAKIQTPFAQDLDRFYTCRVNYVYKENQLYEITKSDTIDEDIYYYSRLMDETPDSVYYHYQYKDIASRFDETGSKYIDTHFRDSISSGRRNNQQGEFIRTYKKILQHQIYPIKKLDLSAEEMSDLITLQEETVYNVVDEMPEFPGGTAEMLNYINRNLKCSFAHIHFQGRLIVSFVVEKDGQITNARLVRGSNDHHLLDECALKVVNEMPQWTPGKHNGKPVRVHYVIPIVIRI